MSVFPYQVVGNQIWPPPIDPSTGTIHGSGWVGTRRVLAIPGIARALHLVSGMIGSMPLNAVRNAVVMPRPLLLDRPQPDRDRSWFVSGQVWDWWLHGNAIQLVTSVDRFGAPKSVLWLSAERVSIVPDGDRVREYRYDGRVLPFERVIHVRRGMDPLAPYRGIGVVEQHMTALARISDLEAYEAAVLRGSGVPSVAVITPAQTSQAEEDDAKARWEQKFAGPGRQPVFLPQGTEVKPLAWSPQEQQLTEARQLSLIDVAHMANLDAFWLNAGEGGAYNYRSASTMYLNLTRQTLAPIIEQLEGSWGPAWGLDYGTELKFDRQAILGDDMETTIRWLNMAVRLGILTIDEARAYIGKSPLDHEQTAVTTKEEIQ